MNGPLEWIAAIGTIIAASLLAADLGRKVTGWGFVLFVAVAITWVVIGLTSDALPIAAMNGVLLLINAWGVYQYLLNPRKKKVIERVEKVAARIEREVEAEEVAERGEPGAGDQPVASEQPGQAPMIETRTRSLA